MWLRCVLVSSFLVAGCSEGQSKKSEQPVVEPAPPARIDASAQLEGETKMVDEEWLALVAKVDTIVYRFHDASVPPPDHRSYTIRITPSMVEKTVDSYGDIVSQQANAIDAAQFASVKELLLGMSAADDADGDKAQEACSGGTGDSLRLMSSDRELYSDLFSSCGAGATGEMHSQVKAIGRGASALLSGPASDGPTRDP